MCIYKSAGVQGDTWDTYSDWYNNPAKRKVGDIIIYLGCSQQPDCDDIGHSGLGHFAIYAGVIDGAAKRVDSLPDGGAAVRSLHTPDSCAIKGQPYAVLHPRYDTPCTGSLRVCKYIDGNGNNEMDPGEGRAWPFHIQGSNGYSADIITDSDGCYVVDSLAPGDYTVTESVPSPDASGMFTYDGRRWRTCSGTPDVDDTKAVVCNETTNFTFCNVCLGKITVRKFNDLNMNKQQDAGEPTIANWPVTLRGTRKNGQAISPIAKTTGPDGSCVFPDLDPGDYTASEEGNGISWQRVTNNCGSTSYCDLRATTADSRHWLFTVAKEENQAPPVVDLCTTSIPPSFGPIDISCTDKVVEFGNVCLTPVQACKFEDPDMSTTQDSDEGGLSGWPFTVTGVRADGRPICPMTKTTGADGCVYFDALNELLPPGKYTIAEVNKVADQGPQWTEEPSICMGQTLYTDWRTTWAGKRWQSTLPRPEDSCRWADGQRVRGVSPSLCFEITDCGTTPQFQFANVCLGEMSAFKFHDKNMNGLYEPQGEPFADANGNGWWDPAEPFTDLTPSCNGRWDEGEYYRDLNGNKQWDKAEPFTDLDSDGIWDEPECPIEGWPFRLYGTRADGRCLCTGDGPNLRKTNADGVVVFQDVPPPSLPNGYTLTERFDVGHCTTNASWQPEIEWAQYHLGAGWDAWRTTYGPIHPPCPPNGCDVTRWEATTPLGLSPLYAYCGATPQQDFGNVCLTTVDGDKLVYDDGLPGVGTPKPGVGWEICLAGKDLAGRDVVPSDASLNPILAVAAPPISLPCKTPVWHSVRCDANGHFRFTDLPPGHYELMERVNCDYKLRMSKPMLSGFDLECCPEEVTLENFRKDIVTKVYQVYPGDSNGLEQHHAGYEGEYGELITAVPGVLKVIPGEKWANYLQALGLCREGPIKTVVLIKDFDGFSQCTDIFRPFTVSQQGTGNIRLWWPLMYEPPTTTWTLKIIYGTKAAVQFPGECVSGYVHEEVWKWVMDTDIPHMKLFVDLLHEVPFGLDEVPLISDEMLYPTLLSKLDAIQAAVDGRDPLSAGLLLGEFEMQVMDSCVATSPARPNPTGPGTGIANSMENPACCKLLVDAEHVGKTLGIFQPVK